MTLAASSILHYWSARYGTTPIYGGRPVHTRSSAARIADQRGILHAPIINTPRIGWDTIDGERRPTMLLELARTNIVLHNRDLTNAAWTKTNITAAKDQVGVDDTASGASKITATAANGTCLQAITLASSSRFQTAYVKRITGSGTINMTMDNGTTWTAITVTTSWTRVEIGSQTLANPTVGFRIVTSGDAIAVDLVQNENGTIPTSAIATTTASVTRSADSFSWGYGAIPQAVAIYYRFIERGSMAVNGRFLQLSDGLESNPQIILFAAYPDTTAYFHSGVVSRTSTLSGPPNLGDTVELVMTLNSSGAVRLIRSVNGAAVSDGGTSATSSIPAAWPTPTRLDINSNGAAQYGAVEAAELKIVKFGDVAASTAQGIMDEMRAFEINAAGEVLA